METNTQQPEENTKTAYPALREAMGLQPEKVEPVPPVAQAAAEPAETPPVPPEPAKTPAAPVFNYDELSDDQKSEMISKLSGGRIKSIDELNPPVQKTAEELEKEQQQLRTSALTWALENGKVKQDDYDKSIVDKSKSDRELALAVFTANLRETDKDIEDDEAEELFKDAYHEGADEKSKLYSVGQNQIKKLADAYRKENFSKIDNIEPEYKEYLQTENQFKGYKAVVKKIVGELPKELSVDIPFKNIDGTSTTLNYKVAVDEKVMGKLLSDYTSQKAFVTRNVMSEGKIDDKVIAQEMNMLVKSMMFDKVMPQILKEHGDKVEQLLMVQLGNKRQPGAQLNTGKQNTETKAPVKNEYRALHVAMNR